MKFQKSLLSAVVGSTFLFASIGSQAESTYGYSAAGTGPVSATARVNISVRIPLLVLLRVGSPGATVDELTFTAAPNGITTEGNSVGYSWDGQAPVFVATAGTPVTLNAFGWTNAANGANLTCAETNNFPTGFANTDITVTTASGTLTHPGTDASCGGSTSFGANAVATAAWTYGVNAAALAAAPAGSYAQTITYTASTL